MVALLGLVCLSAARSSSGADQDPGHPFQLTSSTFDNNTTLPISAIHNIIPPELGFNVCSIDHNPGGNESPELSWTRPRGNTRSFVVVLYDATGSFTHWGMYNIPPDATGLPENAGVPTSPFPQVQNDVTGTAEYDGPCPPPNFPPNVHHYVFTVYALDIMLDLPSSTNFPANAARLYQALIQAGENKHILESASITGLYSTTPPQ
jgi:Raf kinase inhibitor-like YbhB/YbcL family protein